MSNANHSFVAATINGKKYLSVTDAATFLSISERLVYRMLHQRNSPLVSTDWAGRVVIELDSLETEKARRKAKAEVSA